MDGKTPEPLVEDPTLIDRAIELLRTEHSRATTRAGSRLAVARVLALHGMTEPVSGDWSTDDRFWVQSAATQPRQLVTTGEHPTCDCSDFAQTHAPCAHIW